MNEEIGSSGNSMELLSIAAETISFHMVGVKYPSLLASYL